MLYPTLSSSEATLATIHTELYHPPEEYTNPTPITAENPPSKETPLTASTELTDISHGPKSEPPVASGSLLHLLNSKLSPSDSGGALPALSELPILSYTGEYLPQGQVSLNQAALTYADDFARSFGGCETADGSDGEQQESKKKRRRPERKPWSADDLFCLGEGEVEGNLGLGRMPLPPPTNNAEEMEGVAQEEEVGEKHVSDVSVDEDA